MTMNDLSSDELQQWLANHRLCLEAGLNVSQIIIDKAQEVRLELIRRAMEQETA